MIVIIKILWLGKVTESYFQIGFPKSNPDRKEIKEKSRKLRSNQYQYRLQNKSLFFNFQGSVLNGGGYITVIIIFSLLFNFNKLFEYETVYVEIVDHSTNTS